MNNTKNNKKETKIADYRGNCWNGYLDLSLSLRLLKNGQKFSFICEHTQLQKMLDIIKLNCGEVVKRVEKKRWYFRWSTKGLVLTKWKVIFL